MQLTGQKREILGKSVKNLRYDRQLPGVIFGKHKESVPITVGQIDFEKIFEKVGETTVFDLMVDGKKHPVLVKEIQQHYMTGAPMHVGFYEVNLKEKLRANIPVEVINEELNPRIKSGEALVLTLMNEIEVEALPTDLPEKFIVDATKLEDMASVITIKDLEFDHTKVEIQDAELDEVVAKLDYAQMLEEEAEPVDEAEAIAGIEASKEKVAEEEAEEEK